MFFFLLLNTDRWNYDKMKTNTHRSLHQLAVINAWFDADKNDPTRYSLHANVSFREERMGREKSSNIRFRVAIKKCEIVVIPPDRGVSFQIDPRSIKTAAPKVAARQEREREKSVSKKFLGGLRGDRKSVDPNLDVRLEYSKGDRVSTSDIQTIEIMNELHGQSADGFPSWHISGEYEGRLEGSLWDAKNEPRFTISDRRSAIERERSKELAIAPLASIEVRCLREDIHIFDISFKDLEKNEQIQNRAGHMNRIRAAEAFLQTELLKEGLVFGDLSDIFANLTVADAVVPLYE